MRRIAFTAPVLCLVLLGMLFQVAGAQTSQVAQISGRVVDRTGAAIVGAHVSMTNVNTGLNRTTDSGPEGSYNITTLPIGNYTLKATKEGFGTYQQSGIVLAVDTNPTFVITLNVGTIQQEVTVSESAAQVETHDTGVGALVDNQDVIQMPLNGRDITQLVAISGASVTAPPPSGQAIISNKNYPSASAFSIAGAQAGETLFVLDGTYNLDPSSNVGLPYPFPDALQEFKVETSSLPANYGSQPGGFVNVVTKGGTNRLHGGAFEFYRNHAMDAASYFSKVPDSVVRNQLGGELGGPIKKDRIFFFGGYQGTFEQNPPSPQTFFLPTKDVLGITTPGDYDFTNMASAACNNGNQLAKFKGPNFSSGDGYQTTNFNSVAQNYLKLIPAPADQVCGKEVYAAPETDHENEFVGRVDQTLSSRQTLFERYFYTDFEHAPVFNNNLLNLYIDPLVGLHDRVQSVAVGHTFILNPSMVNQFSVAFARNKAIRYSPSGEPTPTSLGSNVTSLVQGFVYFSTTNLSPVCTNCSPSHFDSSIYQISDNFTLIRGRHEIIFGGDWIHNHFNGLSSFQMNGDFTFNGTITGYGLADLVTGSLDSMGQSSGAILHEGVNIPSLYVQDNFKITKRFAFNAGLRWDPYLLPKNYDLHQSIFDLGWFDKGVISTKFPNAPAGTLFNGDPGMPSNGGYGYGVKSNFGPRVGFIYDPRGQGKESLRVGYGIFYGSNPLYLVVGTHAPWADPITIPTPTGGLSNPWAGYVVANPYPLPNPLPSNVTFPVFGGGLGNYPLHSKPTSIQQWSVAIQKQMPGNWLVSATYLGNKTNHLEYNQQLDPVFYVPGTVGAGCTSGQYGVSSGNCSTTGNENYRRVFNSVQPTGDDYAGETLYSFEAIADYNALLVSATHAFTHNFSVLTNYTYSHCLGESDIGLNGGTTPQNPYNLRGDYGNCGADERQIFNLAITAAEPRLSNHLLNMIAGHWQVAPLFVAHTGLYSTEAVGTDVSLLGITARPNRVGNPFTAGPVAANPTCTAPTVVKTRAHWFNPCAFVSAGVNAYGNVGRDTIVGPGLWNLDMQVSRSFPIHREQSVDFRAEAYDLTNTTHFGNPGTSMSSGATNGVITSLAGGQYGYPRILQLAAKYNF
jgi:hypothetical protein